MIDTSLSPGSFNALTECFLFYYWTLLCKEKDWFYSRLAFTNIFFCCCCYCCYSVYRTVKVPNEMSWLFFNSIEWLLLYYYNNKWRSQYFKELWLFLFSFIVNFFFPRVYFYVTSYTAEIYGCIVDANPSIHPFSSFHFHPFNCLSWCHVSLAVLLLATKWDDL